MPYATQTHRISFSVRGQNQAEVEQAALNRLDSFLTANDDRVVDIYLSTTPGTEMTTPGDAQPRYLDWKCEVEAQVRSQRVFHGGS